MLPFPQRPLVRYARIANRFLIASLALTALHMLLTYIGVVFELPIYWLCPLAYALCAWTLLTDHPSFALALLLMGVSFMLTILNGVLRFLGEGFPAFLYYGVQILLWIAQAFLRIGYTRELEKRNASIYPQVTRSVVIACCASLVLEALLVLFDGPHNSPPLSLSQRAAAAALALQLIQLGLFAFCTRYHPRLEF